MRRNHSIGYENNFLQSQDTRKGTKGKQRNIT